MENVPVDTTKYKVKIKKKRNKNFFVENIKIIISSLILITSLAWNSAFTNFFEKTPYLKSYGPWAYAIGISIFTTIIVYYLRYLKRKIKQKDIT